jgi:hypothetical protein
MDDGTCARDVTTSTGLESSYTCDPDSAKLYGTCREKSSDVLGKKCQQHHGSSLTSTPNAFSYVLEQRTSTSASGSASRAIVNSGGSLIARPISDTVTDATPSNEDFVEGSNGICGEFRFYNATGVTVAINDADNVGTPDVPYLSLAGTLRTALWVGFCDEQRVCRECVPGAGARGSGAQFGQICLNGQMYAAADVDGTSRSYTENTQAGTQLGTTFMVILLILLFAIYMYAQAREFRHANGLKPLTCCEVLLCCGVCSKIGGKEARPVAADKTAAGTASPIKPAAAAATA